MVKEKDRREMLARRKTMRRHQTLLKNSTSDFYASVKTAWKNGATPTELARFLDLSIARVKQIVYDEGDKNEDF